METRRHIKMSEGDSSATGQVRRRRRSSGNPNLPLSLEAGYQIKEGGPSQGTPSPSTANAQHTSKTALEEFRRRQQSFDIQIEECDEEDILVESDDEAEPEDISDRGVTPTPIQDFAANVTYMEGPQPMDFLKVSTSQNECITDVSDAESEGNEE